MSFGIGGRARACSAALVLALCGAAVPAAQAALGSESLQLRAFSSLRHESNVFRQPDNVSSPAPNGTFGRGDNITTVGLGGGIEVPVSQQKLAVSYDLTRNTYAKFTTLDYDGVDSLASWKMVVGPHFTGTLGYSYSKFAPGFANSVGTAPNTRTTTRRFFDGSYAFPSNWIATFGVAGNESNNSNIANSTSNNETNTATLGLRYASAQNNVLGLQVLQSDTRFPNSQVINGVPVNQSFDQTETSIVMGWQIGAMTRLSGNVGRTTRKQIDLNGITFSENTGNLLFNWQPTAKSGLDVIYRRDLGSPADINTTSTTVKTLAIKPYWNASAMVSVTGNWMRLVRDYPPITIPQRIDTTNTKGLSVVYRPLLHLSLSLSVQREHRDSTIPINDYFNNTVSATAQYAF